MFLQYLLRDIILKVSKCSKLKNYKILVLIYLKKYLLLKTIICDNYHVNPNSATTYESQGNYKKLSNLIANKSP